MKLIINYMSTLLYQVMVVILPIITLPYLSRVFLPQNMGINSLMVSVSSYFLLFAVFGLAVHGQKEVAYCANDEQHLAKVFWEIEILSILLTFVSCMAYVFTIFLMPKYTLYILATAPLIMANALDISWLFIGLQKLPMVMTRNLIVKLATVATIFLFVKNNNDLLILMLINSISALISNASLWAFMPEGLHFVPLKIKNLKQHFVSGAFLFLPTVSIAIYTVLSRVILGVFGSVKDVAYFDNSDKIIRTLLTIITSATLTIMPEIAKLSSNQKNDEIFSLLKKVLLLSIAFVVPVTVGTVIISKQFAIIFFGLPYRITGNVMQIEIWIMIPIAIANVVANQYFVPMNKSKYITYAVLAGATINVLISVPLVESFGAIGSAVAILITEVSVAIIQVWQMGKSFKRIIEGKEIIKIFLAATVMGIVSLIFKQIINDLNIYFQFVLIIFVGIVSYILMLISLKSYVVLIPLTKIMRRQ